MNFRLDIEYDGFIYAGWQVQPNEITVQGEIEKALNTVLRSEIKIIGAGRTDAGVHAKNQVANFSFNNLDISFLTDLKYSLNGILKDGITIKNIKIVNDDFHARYSAKSRSYTYSMSKVKRSIDRNQFYILPWKIDIQKTRSAASKLKGIHDFLMLSVAKNYKSTICNVFEIKIDETQNEIFLHITANRFLHKMVRMITGLLIDIGRGKLEENIIEKLFNKNINIKPYFCAPSKGLCLVNVGY